MACQAVLRFLACTLSTIGPLALTVHKSSDNYEPNPQAVYYKESKGIVMHKNASGLIRFSRMHPMTVPSPAASWWWRKTLTVVGADQNQESMLLGSDGQVMSRETAHVHHLCDLWNRSNQKWGHFLDVGAGIGTYAIPLAACAQGWGEMLAVETDESKLDLMRTSMLANFNWNLRILKYCFHEDDTLNRTTGDALVKSIKEIKKTFLVRINIPGHEKAFLRGSSELFTKFPPPFVLLETNPELLEKQGESVDGLLAQLNDWNFHVNATSDDIETPTKRIVMLKYGRPSEHKERLKQLNPKWGEHIPQPDEWDESIPKPN